MADNQLILKQEGLVPLLEESGMAALLQPLTREIHLFDSFVAGTARLKNPAVLDTLTEGTKLRLQREENKFDDNAILLLTQQGQKVGYVPEKDNLVFARLMDAGKLLSATVTSIQKKGFLTMIGIGIYLVDF